jgi:hypothetical protein
MKGNVPIPELVQDEEAWIIAVVASVRECSAKNGKRYFDATAQNATGRVTIRVWPEAYDDVNPIKPGIWKIAGKLSVYLGQSSFSVTKYKEVTLGDYQGFQRSAPPLPRAYTMDIETLALPAFRDRAPKLLERDLRLEKLRSDQRERYLADPGAEAERVYQLGSLSATSGRVLSIAVHVGPQPEFAHYGAPQREVVCGIDERGKEVDEAEALRGFVKLMNNYDRDTDEIVGHNICSFDLPFVFQRCLVNDIQMTPFVNLAEYHVKGVFDTMRKWWLGDRKTVSLDDVAWALGLQSSKTDEVEGSKVFDLYHAGRLDEIREYNLNDVRLTRKLYERLVRVFGR